MELGRNYVGIELSREYVAMSGKRLRATQPGLVGL
jgi:DNA modification methylase